MEGAPEDRQAKFNEGFYKVFRLSKLKESCHDARLFSDYGKWFTCLQGIRSEINSKLRDNVNEKEKKADPNAKSERDIANEYDNAMQLWKTNKKDVEITVMGIKGRVKDLDIYNVLYSYELWLEDMKEKYKFGMPEEDSASQALK